MLQPGTISASGRVLAGRYRIDALLGQGTTGPVYEGTHVLLDNRVAIKLIHRDVADQGFWRGRFYEEARLLARVSSPWVAQVHDFGEDEESGALFLVMEYVGGVDLARLIAERGPLDPRRACAIGAQVLHGLDAAHGAGVLHRDLSLSNIMVISADSGQPFAKVIDFGVGTATNPDGEAEDEVVVGTPAVMAPERIRREPEDPRTDIYSFGVVLYAMLTGRLPFAGPTPEATLRMQLTEEPRLPSRVAPDRGIPAELDAVVMQCLAKSPGSRFPTARAAAEVIEYIEKTLSPQIEPRPADGEAEEPADEPVVELCRALARAYDSFRVYPRTNVAYRESMNAAGRLLSKLFEADDGDVVELCFDRYAIHHRGRRVFEDIDRRGLPHALWADGLRVLCFCKGLTRRQLDQMFDCLYRGAARKGRGPGPVARMWEHAFEHVRFLVAPDIEPGPLPTARDLAQCRRDCGWSEHTRPPRGARTDCPDSPSSALMQSALTDIEVADIAARIAEEKGLDPNDRLVRGLLSTLRGCGNPVLAGELLGVLGDLAHRQLREHKLASALTILEPIAGLRTKPGGRTVADAIEASLARCADPETVRMLVNEVGSSDTAVRPVLLVRYARAMGPSLIAPLIDTLPHLIDEPSENAVMACLTALCKADPRVLSRYAQGAYGAAGFVIVRVLMRVGTPECGPVLGRIVRSPDPALREQAVLALDVVNHPRKIAWLGCLVNDPSEAVRVAAYDALAGLPHAEGRRPLLSLLDADDLSSRGAEELDALFGALCRVESPEIVQALEERLKGGGGWLGRTLGKLKGDADSDPVRYSMVRCLELMDHPEAAAALGRLAGVGR